MATYGKKKRVSKKAPKSWRKNIDITDVEDFLEEIRLDERLGKEDAEDEVKLFVEDKKSDPALLLTLKEKRKFLANKPLKSLTALVNTSKVSDPVGSRPRVKSREEGMTAIIRKQKRAQGIIPKKELISKKDRDRGKILKVERLKNRKNKEEWKKDIWQTDEEKPIPEELKNEWFEPIVVKHTMQNTRVICQKAPGTARHKSKKMLAVEAPHPGTSYNPALKDHQNLLSKVIEKESKIINTENHLDRVTTFKFTRMTAEERDRNYLNEMSAGLEGETEIKEEPSENSENEDSYKTINGPVKNKKKDLKSRRKQHEQRLLRQNLRLQKVEKKKRAELHQLKALGKVVEEHSEELKEIDLKRRQRLRHKKYESGRIAPMKFEEGEIDVSLPENMSGNLRNLKPEGQLLLDRFKSLQKRSIVPPAKHAGIKKRALIKRYVRNTHKEPQLPIVNKKNKVKMAKC